MNPITLFIIYLVGMLLSFIMSILFWIKHLWKFDVISWTPNYFIHFTFLMFSILFGTEAIQLEWKYSPYSHYMPHDLLFTMLISSVGPFVFMMFMIWIIGRQILAHKKQLQSQNKTY